MSSISMRSLVNSIPQVLGAGGNAIDVIGLVLTPNPRLPAGFILNTTSVTDVINYFGAASAEAQAAPYYFNGYNGEDRLPGSLLWLQYNTTPMGAYVRGASLAGLPLATLQSYTGTMSLTVDGVVKSAASPVNLAAATSPSNAATIIGTALGVPVTYDAIANAFVISSTTTGSTSTVTFATGTLANLLGLTSAAGAVLSQGTPAMTPATIMAQALTLDQDWATFTYLVEPSLADKLSFAQWTNNQQNQFGFIAWDSDGQARVQGSTTCFGYQLGLPAYSGTSPVDCLATALMIMGTAASIDFAALNGRVNFMFRSQSGLTPTVTDNLTAAALLANGYNFYGQYSLRNQQFNFLRPGSVSGPFAWLDSFINQLWLNANLILALAQLVTTVKSIPYNADGDALIEAAILDVVRAAVNFGAIRANVPLSAAEAAEVNLAAGVAIDGVLSTRGWYIQILVASPSVRGVRGSPPCKFWYTDGGSVQSINLVAVEVQ